MTGIPNDNSISCECVLLFSSNQVVGGPSTYTMYITALYFCMTCMTSIGFGNVAADTDNEKVSAPTNG